MAWLARLCSKINIFLYFEADRFTKIRSSLGWNMYFDVIESNFTILFSSQNKPHNCWKISEKVYHCATQYIFLSCCWAGRTGEAVGGHVILPDFGRFWQIWKFYFLALIETTVEDDTGIRVSIVPGLFQFSSPGNFGLL